MTTIRNVLDKDRFCRAINELEAAENLRRKVATAIRQYNSLTKTDFPNPYGLMISHSALVINLLAEIMGDKFGLIEYFCTELDFGRKYTPGCVIENGEEVDLSNEIELYNYLTRGV